MAGEIEQLTARVLTHVIGHDADGLAGRKTVASLLAGTAGVSATPTAGRLARWLNATSVEDAGAAISTDGTLASNSDAKVPTEKAVKTYVDGLAVNLGKRARTRAATTANITIATALNNGDTLDGITLATGDLVLVKNQSSQAENGVYVVGATPVRAAEFDTYNEHPGSLIAVAEGTANADTLWLCTSNDGGTLNTAAIAFSKMVIAGELLVTDIGVTVQGYDAATAKLNVENQTLTGGVEVTSKALNGGSAVTTGTLTLDMADRPQQHYTNGGAHTLAPGTVVGSCMLDITNNASAGAVTTSGWNRVAGDPFTTTNGHKFRCHCSVGNAGSLLIIQAMQ